MTVLTHARWFSLPLKLRQRWWKETDYGNLPPSAELMAEIEAVPASGVSASIGLTYAQTGGES
jgi:hypothetical protein